MKFGSQLKANRAPHWKFHFVDYDGLKALLKAKSHGREFTEQDEAQFEKLLLTELDKVASFQTLKLGEVQRRIEHCEHIIQQHQLSGSSEKLTLASFVATESEINKITKDLQDLARFQRLNYTAFLKIIKKHDKHTSGFSSLRVTFMINLQNKPFHKECFTPFVSRLSSLYSIVRTGTASAEAKARSIDSSEEDEYLDHPGLIPSKSASWVHPDNVMDLKMLILKYLPLVVYEPTPNSSRSPGQGGHLACESSVSTIYLDNQDLDLYMAQVEHQDKTEAVRLRWFGSDQKHLWVEHQQKNSSLSSSSSNHPDYPTVTKHRFQIKSKQVPQLLQGSANLTKAFDQLRRSGQKSDLEMQEFEERTRIIQSRIKKRGLKPLVQTFFNRTTFQIPGDARVRITLDTDVVMVRERSLFSLSSPNMSDASPASSPTTLRATMPLPSGKWCPSVDLKPENYPFAHVHEQDIVRFPYAILQIRTLTEPQEEIPWIDHVAQSHLVEMVPNFAKDQHAIASLFESRVGLLPFWLSDMDRDIRKQAVPSGFPRRITSFAAQESNDSVSSSGSNDTFNSAASSPASSVSDSGSPGSSSPKAKEKKEGRAKKVPGSGVKFDAMNDLAVNRLEIQHRPSLEPLSESSTSKGKGKGKRPVVSCLKKPVSYSSFQSSNSDGELSSPTASSGSGGSNSSKKRVTFKPSQQHFWDKAHNWIPFVHSGTEGEVDLEAQYSRSRARTHEGPFTWSSISMFGRRVSWTKMFWTCLSGLNIAMLFVGLVVALMNLGDGVGTEAASLFLIVSCLCMSSTVWAHLSRMDGDDDNEDDQEEDRLYEGLNAIKAQTANSERVGLLTSLPSSSNKSQPRSTGAASQGRWVRTRLMPLVTCVCLATVVTMNIMARA
ncbi:hypothetical protein MVEG_02295 [Podila verticillata NRRL 6337]|nr:hypothetical protein MVEG_02295 [Podila verticillata NRRL 6337]